ncbi:MAG: diaminopimelate decarboxylase, partial [Candidatus Rokuibacteriota bacterium]
MREYAATGGKLLIDGVDPHEVVRQTGTPVYLYEQRRIEANYKRLAAAFEGRVKQLRIHYAMKANSSLAVLRVLEKLGARIDAVTMNEV